MANIVHITELLPVILRAAEKHKVDPVDIIALMMTESGKGNFTVDTEALGDETSGGRGRAKGLMQLMDSNIKKFGVTDPFDIVQNVDTGTALWKEVLASSNGDKNEARARYNFGSGNIDKGKPLPQETKDFLPKVAANAVKAQQLIGPSIGAPEAPGLLRSFAVPDSIETLLNADIAKDQTAQPTPTPQAPNILTGLGDIMAGGAQQTPQPEAQPTDQGGGLSLLRKLGIITGAIGPHIPEIAKQGTGAILGGVLDLEPSQGAALARTIPKVGGALSGEISGQANEFQQGLKPPSQRDVEPIAPVPVTAQRPEALQPDITARTAPEELPLSGPPVPETSSTQEGQKTQSLIPLLIGLGLGGVLGKVLGGSGKKKDRGSSAAFGSHERGSSVPDRAGLARQEALLSLGSTILGLSQRQKEAEANKQELQKERDFKLELAGRETNKRNEDRSQAIAANILDTEIGPARDALIENAKRTGALPEAFANSLRGVESTQVPRPGQAADIAVLETGLEKRFLQGRQRQQIVANMTPEEKISEINLFIDSSANLRGDEGRQAVQTLANELGVDLSLFPATQQKIDDTYDF